MATDKDKLMRGVNIMAFAFPLVLLGPSLYFWKGANSWQNGQWWWGVISLLIMGVAIYLSVKGFKMILAGIFGD
jgi:hypothetical protein